jgi:hypothetical protein
MQQRRFKRLTERQKRLLKRLKKEEICALAYGFPMPKPSYYSNFNNDLESTGATTDVNGAWKPLKPLSSEFVGDEYDNFLTKKSRERRELKKELRDEGVSRKDARKQALEEIPRDSLKEVVSSAGEKVGRGIVVGALSIPRASYLSLVAINFRGLAYKIKAIANLENGTPSNVREELKKKWYKLGGDWDALVDSANKGATKKPFFCGKKCKKALADKNLKRNFVEDVEFDTFSYITGVDDIAVGTWIGLGGSVLATLGGIVAKGIENSQQKREIASAEKIAEQENKMLSEADKRAYEIEISKLAQEGNPRKLIANNPNLSADEKRSALKVLDEAEQSETTSNLKRFAIYGGLALVGLFLISKISKSK